MHQTAACRFKESLPIVTDLINAVAIVDEAFVKLRSK